MPRNLTLDTMGIGIFWEAKVASVILKSLSEKTIIVDLISEIER